MKLSEPLIVKSPDPRLGRGDEVIRFSLTVSSLVSISARACRQHRIGGTEAFAAVAGVTRATAARRLGFSPGPIADGRARLIDVSRIAHVLSGLMQRGCALRGDVHCPMIATL